MIIYNGKLSHCICKTFVGLIVYTSLSIFSYAAAPIGGYLPGATLDPNCAPNDTDCIVQNIGTENDPLRKFIEGSGSLNAVYTGGNVGVGTNDPIRELDVEGTTRLGSNVYIGENTPQSYVMARVISEDTTLKLGASRSSNGNAVYIGSQTNSPISFIVGDTNKAIIEVDGDMGLGTLTPDGDFTIERTDIHAKLNVNNKDAAGYTQIRATAGSASGYIYSMGQNYVTSGAWKSNSSAFAGTGTGGLSIVAQDSVGDIRFYAGGQTDSHQTMTIIDGGKVGIGTNTPSEMLEIGSSGRIFIGDGGVSARKGLLIDGKESTTGGTDFVRLHSFDYGTNDSMNMVLNPYGSGNVGIMNSKPMAQLQVGNNSTLFTAGNDNLHLGDNIYYENGVGYKRISDENNSSLLFMGSNGDTVFYSNSDTHTGASTNITLQNNITIKKDGKVGIGTATPEVQLHVAGDVKYEGAIQQGVSGAHIKKAFYKYSNTSSASNKYIHLKTNQTMNSKMITLKFYGFEYGATKTIDAQVSYYPYGALGDIHSQDDSGTHELGVYKSSDGYAVVTIKVDSVYHIGFYVDAFGPGPQGLWSDINITDTLVADTATGEF